MCWTSWCRVEEGCGCGVWAKVCRGGVVGLGLGQVVCGRSSPAHAGVGFGAGRTQYLHASLKRKKSA